MTTNLASWLLSSRVSPPRISINASRRDDLLQLLQQNSDKPVVMLEAPAGFGKTLLLSQWREVQKLENKHVAWLSVNTTDQVDTILPYIAFAFHQAGLDTASTNLLSPGYKQGEHAFLLGQLLSVIEQKGESCIIVFDDFENISDDCLVEIISPLLKQLPANLQLVFACRKNPGLSLSSMAVEGNVFHLGPQDLMFSRDEVDHFFQNKLGQKELDNIMDRTGGWPVALQLIRSFGGTSSIPDNLAAGAGNRLINDYFREQLLNNLSQNERALLLETSMLDTITIDCADYIREREDTAETVHGLDYLEGIVSPLEDEEEAWRIHPLVREHLLQELKDTSVEKYKSLNLRTAAWMAAHDRGLEAMRFALAADAPDYAADILEDMGGIMLWIREGMSRLTAGLELLKAYPLDSHPRIQLGRCLLLTKYGDIRGARQAFEKARQVSADFQSDRRGGDNALLKVERYSIEIMLAEYGCSPAHPILPEEAFAFMLENTEDEPVIQGYIKTLQCLTSLQMGDFENCIKHGEYAIKEYLTGHSRYGELFLYFYFGMAELAQGRTAESLKHYNHAMQMIHAEFPGDTGLKLLGNAVLAEYYLETGDMRNTKKHMRQVIDNISEMEAYFDIYMSAYHTAIIYLLFDRGVDEAMGFIDTALAHARKQSLERLEAFLICKQVSVLYLVDDKDAALAIVGAYPQVFKQNALSLMDKTWREVEALALALNRVARMSGDLESYEAIQREALAVGGETRNVRLIIKLQLQDALNASQAGDTDTAEQKLRAAAELAEGSQYLGPFLNELPWLGEILEPALAKAEHNDKPFLQALLALKAQQKPIPGTSDEFSPREVQILGELALGQPDKLIARQTGLSAHGVRYHLKNIYAKMGVENRVQAISRAREMELIQ